MTRQLFSGFLLALWVGLGAGYSQAAPAATNGPRLVIRCDDVGFCHGVNAAFKRIAEQGMVSAASVMVNSPWLDEAVEILKQHPEISVGVHLTLNSEWKEYKLGPVTPYDQVSSLVDPFGKFHGTRKEFFARRPQISEVARELRAQIDLAQQKGLKISYIDNHMGTAISTLEFQEEMEKIAKEYGIGISRYFGEREVPNVYAVAPEQKLSQALENLQTVTNAGLYLMVFHVGTDDPEMRAMTDVHTYAPKNMSVHRQAEAEVLCSPEFKAALKSRGIRLVGYEEVRATETMRRPFVSEPYEDVVKKAVAK
jgi:hypothetical protein